MEKRKRLLHYRKTKSPIHLECSLNLSKLFPTIQERERFEAKWPAFLESDPHNHEVYQLKRDSLIYRTEQLIPDKRDQRPPLLMVFGNPATHSISAGMFFAFKGDGKENRLWKNLLKPAGILDMAVDEGTPAMRNELRRKGMMGLDYVSPFRIGVCVYISMPSAAGGIWSGVAGVRKLIGSKALPRLESIERERIMHCARSFLEPGGSVVTFQKNAWEGLRSDGDPPYAIDVAKKGKLTGSLGGMPDIPLFGVPPTRLIGPCRKVLKKLLVQ